MTSLRKMMLEELQRRNYSAITTRNYLRVVTDFAKYFGKSPDKLGPNELRTYRAYLLQDRKLTPGTVVNWVTALRFFFVKTLKRHQFREFLPYPQDRRRLPSLRSERRWFRPLYQFGWLRYGEVTERKEELVAVSRFVPNRKFLSIPFRSELIHSVA